LALIFEYHLTRDKWHDDEEVIKSGCHLLVPQPVPFDYATKAAFLGNMVVVQMFVKPELGLLHTKTIFANAVWGGHLNMVIWLRATIQLLKGNGLNSHQLRLYEYISKREIKNAGRDGMRDWLHKHFAASISVRNDKKWEREQAKKKREAKKQMERLSQCDCPLCQA
jgi:hypothetical protein